MIDFPHLKFDEILVLKIVFFYSDEIDETQKTSNDRARKYVFLKFYMQNHMEMNHSNICKFVTKGISDTVSL